MRQPLVIEEEQSPPLDLPQAIDAQINGDPCQQRSNGSFIKRFISPLPEPDERLLRLVARVFEIAKHVIGKGDHFALMAFDNQLELGCNVDLGFT